jgi:putative aldouronate transport system permease protein
LEQYFRKSLSNKIFDVFNLVFMCLFTFIMVYPFINQLALSFNDGADAVRGGIYFFPRKVSLQAYSYVFQNKILLKGAGVSVMRVIVGTATCLICTGLLAYVVTVKNFSGARFLRLLYIITMYVLGGLIPFYILILKLHLNNTFNVYWIPHLFSTYYMLILSSYFQGIPDAVSESARIDGASELSIFSKIMVPMSLPAFACIAVFTGVFQWNSWFDVYLFSTNRHWDNLQIILNRLLNEVQTQTDIRDAQLIYSKYLRISPVTVRAATTMIVTMPIIFIYPFFQRYFIGGITLGAVKG